MVEAFIWNNKTQIFDMTFFCWIWTSIGNIGVKYFWENLLKVGILEIDAYALLVFPFATLRKLFNNMKFRK